MVIYDRILTPIGQLGILCTKENVLCAHLDASTFFCKIKNSMDWKEGENARSILVKEQLLAYFANKRTSFDLPLLYRATPFQTKVWDALQTIPFGQKRSYEDVSLLISGEKRFCRAVGLANGLNPFLLIVPCHRVIQKNGKNGGYSAGIAQKEWLLHFEEGKRQ